MKRMATIVMAMLVSNGIRDEYESSRNSDPMQRKTKQHGNKNEQGICEFWDYEAKKEITEIKLKEEWKEEWQVPGI